jgi:hypothetical protein
MNDVKIHALPFGKHKDKPLSDVPTAYLQWAIRECKLSSGLRTAVADELTRRGVEAPPPPPPPPIPRCRRCGDAGYSCNWQTDSAGRKRIRASCRRCGSHLTFPPCREPFTTQADRNASPAPILDALTRLGGLGVELLSNGRSVYYKPGDWQKVPDDLCTIVRQASHELAKMMGDTRRAGG